MEAKPTSGEDWTEESRVRQGLIIGGPYKEVQRGRRMPQIGGAGERSPPSSASFEKMP
jgi:hypothetical protein